MAISISEQYPGKTDGNTPEYPYGKARNITTPGDGTGTPWEAAIVNDDQGFKQALLQAAGIVPSGVPDTAQVSQLADAIRVLAVQKAYEAIGLVCFGVNQDYVLYGPSQRNYNVTYTNNTARSIYVTVCSPDTVSQSPLIKAIVNGKEVIESLYDFGTNTGTSVIGFFVPPGKTYMVSLTGATLNPTKWSEYR